MRKPERPGKRHEIPREIFFHISGSRGVRPPESPQVGDDHAEMRGKVRDLVSPHPPVPGPAVKHHEGLPFAGLGNMHLQPAESDKTVCDGHSFDRRERAPGLRLQGRPSSTAELAGK